MRVLVCGGRDYRDRHRLFLELDRLHVRQTIALVIQGGAAGADTIARDWSLESDVPCATVEADWSLGRRAGPIRNAKMLRECQPDLVIAFPGGRGTADMIRQAEAAGVPVLQVPPPLNREEADRHG